jgi:hypothetical protein
MNLLPPRVLGPLSECNRSVIIANGLPGATVTIIAKRGSVDHLVGQKAISGSKGTIPLDSTAELVEGDLVNASQELGGDRSPTSTDGPEVQKSVAQFDAVQVLTHLYQCSRGFFLGGMRPGTHVEIHQGATSIGAGDAIDGTAFITVPNGLPLASGLIAHQMICPKPPGAPGLTLYLFDSPLPSVAAFPYHTGQTVPAPKIVKGLTACSRSIEATGIQPGAEIFVEGTGGGWWAWLGESDNTDQWVNLPVKLREGEEVSVRQEVAPRCELNFERKLMKVAAQKALDKPRLAQIDCNTTETIYGVGLKPEADVEFSVTPKGGAETRYRSTATESYGPLPAPPMPPGATVLLRQGECDVWSPWSDPQIANPLAAPPLKPKISHKIFSCQDAIPIENLFPLNGYLRVLSAKHGELHRLPVGGNVMVVPVAPSFTYPDDVWVEHHVCGAIAGSDKESVQPPHDVLPATIKAPLFDGDTVVVMMKVSPGARVELWEQTTNRLLQQGRAFGDTGSFDIVFSSFGALQGGWNIYGKAALCGHYVQTPSIPVVFKAPVLTSIAPAARLAGGAAFLLTLNGENFRSGSKVQWNLADRPTTFVSAKQLHAPISAADISSPKTVPIRIVNPDGQTSGTVYFTVSTTTPPPPPGYDELLIQNCNSNTIAGSVPPLHRPIHIYYRAVASPPGPWIPIWDSPHDADYDASGYCPSSPSAGARFALADGVTYEVVCTDPELYGCASGSPDEPACRRSAVFVVHGKTGGGTKTVIVN